MRLGDLVDAFGQGVDGLLESDTRTRRRDEARTRRVARRRAWPSGSRRPAGCPGSAGHGATAVGWIPSSRSRIARASGAGPPVRRLLVCLLRAQSRRRRTRCSNRPSRPDPPRRESLDRAASRSLRHSVPVGGSVLRLSSWSASSSARSASGTSAVGHPGGLGHSTAVTISAGLPIGEIASTTPSRFRPQTGSTVGVWGGAAGAARAGDAGTPRQRSSARPSGAPGVADLHDTAAEQLPAASATAPLSYWKRRM